MGVFGCGTEQSGNYPVTIVTNSQTHMMPIVDALNPQTSLAIWGTCEIHPVLLVLVVEAGLETLPAMALPYGKGLET